MDSQHVNPNTLAELKKMKATDCIDIFKLMKFFQSLNIWIPCYIYPLIAVKLKCFHIFSS